MADSQRIEDLRRRVQKDPASIAFAQLAEELRRAGMCAEAIDVCRTGLELHPGYLSARVTLGRALLEVDDLEAALGELEHVLKSAPENLAAIRALAETHHRRGSLVDALAQYRAALALARNDPDLQQTVDELARQVEPPPPPASADGLSFEQVQNEFLQNLAPPPAPPAPATPAVPSWATPVPVEEPVSPAELEPEHSANQSAVAVSVPAAVSVPVAASVPVPVSVPVAVSVPVPVPVSVPDDETADHVHAQKLIAVLGQWLDAIHVVRAQPRA